MLRLISIITLVLFSSNCFAGCYVYSSKGVFGQWEGTCLNGKATGSGSSKVNSGSVYYGSARNGYFDGEGYISSGNQSFDGIFKNGTEFIGTLKFYETGARFIGEFKNRVPYKGVLMYRDNSFYSGEFAMKDKKLIFIKPETHTIKISEDGEIIEYITYDSNRGIIKETPSEYKQRTRYRNPTEQKSNNNRNGGSEMLVASAAVGMAGIVMASIVVATVAAVASSPEMVFLVLVPKGTNLTALRGSFFVLIK